jgi:hypothetical protein
LAIIELKGVDSLVSVVISTDNDDLKRPSSNLAFNCQDMTTLLASPESHNWMVCIPAPLIVFAV